MFSKRSIQTKNRLDCLSCPANSNANSFSIQIQICFVTSRTFFNLIGKPMRQDSAACDTHSYAAGQIQKWMSYDRCSEERILCVCIHLGSVCMHTCRFGVYACTYVLMCVLYYSIATATITPSQQPLTLLASVHTCTYSLYTQHRIHTYTHKHTHIPIHIHWLMDS